MCVCVCVCVACVCVCVCMCVWVLYVYVCVCVHMIIRVLYYHMMVPVKEINPNIQMMSPKKNFAKGHRKTQKATNLCVCKQLGLKSMTTTTVGKCYAHDTINALSSKGS